MEKETSTTPEIDIINEMMGKLVGGYELMSKAFIATQISELKTRVDKSAYEFKKLQKRIDQLESDSISRDLVERLIEVAKTKLRDEMVTQLKNT